jgi:hypothetical protein
MSMEARLRADMLTLIERYSHYKGYEPATVCKTAHGDPRFYGQLKDGRESADGARQPLLFSAYTYDRVVSHLLSVWPAGLDWPEGIPRIKTTDVRARPRKQREDGRTPRKPRAQAPEKGGTELAPGERRAPAEELTD